MRTARSGRTTPSPGGPLPASWTGSSTSWPSPRRGRSRILAGNYWEQEILKLNAAGVYLGNNGKALAADSITRQQAVTMVARAFGIQSTTSVLPYTDAASVSEYAIPAVAEFTARGWLN